MTTAGELRGVQVRAVQVAGPLTAIPGHMMERSGHQVSQKPADRTGQNWAVNGGLDM